MHWEPVFIHQPQGPIGFHQTAIAISRSLPNVGPGIFAPAAATLASLLTEIVESRCKGVVLEVSQKVLQTIASTESHFTPASLPTLLHL